MTAFSFNERINLELRFLDQLQYPDMTYRHDRIAEAYQKTFTWIFEEQNDTETGIGFRNWLESGSDLYWVTGKPESGKSTLIKYICEDDRISAHLAAWASPSPLITAFFYFCNSGTPVQMSEHGLLRSLLFQILHEVLDLFPRLFPGRWELAIFFWIL